MPEPVCLVCGAPLQYWQDAVSLECHFCHKTFSSNCSCEAGHYVCDECHSREGIRAIRSLSLSEKSKDPIEIAQRMMEVPLIYMHGPEHHTLVGAALLCAYHNSGGNIDLSAALDELISRSSKVPGGICGFWGNCGAAVGAGIFMSIVTQSTPLSTDTWGLCNLLTSRCLHEIGIIGGPRCCKRNSFLAIRETVLFTDRYLGVSMQLPAVIRCDHIARNPECIGNRCPFSPGYIKAQVQEKGI